MALYPVTIRSINVAVTSGQMFCDWFDLLNGTCIHARTHTTHTHTHTHTPQPLF